MVPRTAKKDRVGKAGGGKKHWTDLWIAAAIVGSRGGWRQQLLRCSLLAAWRTPHGAQLFEPHFPCNARQPRRRPSGRHRPNRPLYSAVFPTPPSAFVLSTNLAIGRPDKLLIAAQATTERHGSPQPHCLHLEGCSVTHNYSSLPPFHSPLLPSRLPRLSSR